MSNNSHKEHRTCHWWHSRRECADRIGIGHEVEQWSEEGGNTKLQSDVSASFKWNPSGEYT